MMPRWSARIRENMGAINKFPEMPWDNGKSLPFHRAGFFDVENYATKIYGSEIFDGIAVVAAVKPLSTLSRAMTEWPCYSSNKLQAFPKTVPRLEC